MAKMKPGQISAKRAYELSDSLNNNAYVAKSVGKGYMKAADAMKKRESKSGMLESRIIVNSNKMGDFTELTGSEGVKSFATSLLNRASANSEKANRLKSRADAAMAKANAAVGRDVPLPSSEGLFSKIKNIFN